jgi:hypothetical protein
MDEMSWWIRWVDGWAEVMGELSWWIRWVDGWAELMGELSWWMSWVDGWAELMDEMSWWMDVRRINEGWNLTRGCTWMLNKTLVFLYYFYWKLIRRYHRTWLINRWPACWHSWRLGERHHGKREPSKVSKLLNSSPSWVINNIILKILSLLVLR